MGHGLLWGGNPNPYIKAQGFGAVYFAEEMMKEKGDSLEGKRCLITGSHYVAMAVAEKLLELGAIPITFSDTSGYIYEPNGFNVAKVSLHALFPNLAIDLPLFSILVVFWTTISIFLILH